MSAISAHEFSQVVYPLSSQRIELISFPLLQISAEAQRYILSSQIQQQELLWIICRLYTEKIEISTMSLQSIKRVLGLFEQLDKSLQHLESLNQEQHLILEALLARGV